MSEVATKKSINVVSNKKSEVCGVQSNNGLIDLDDLTASNNQLISLCDDDDDDLILTNNTRNELESDDKSLQELIESELALRICSSKNENENVPDTEEPEEIVTQPETIKKIVLDRRQDPVDINTEFIAAESEHYSLIEEPYGHRNGHVSPNANVKPEPIGFRDEEEEQVFVEQPEVDAATIIVQKVSDDDQSSRDEAVNGTVPSSTNDPDSSNIAYALTDETGSQPLPIPATCLEDKHEREEELAQKVLDDSDLLQLNVDQEKKDTDDNFVLDTWSEQASLSDGQQAGQFSDNFDEAIYQQEQILKEQNPLKESSTSDKLDNFSDYVEKEEKITPFQDNTSTSKLIEFEEDPRCIESTEQSANFDNSKQKPLETKCYEDDATVGKRLSVEVPPNDLQTPTESILDNESAEDSKDVCAEDTQNPDESSSELSVSDSTFIEKTEVVVSDTSVTIFSEKHIVEQTENLDSWTTVEEATKPAAEELNKKDTSIAAEHGDLNDVTENDSEDKQDDDLLASPRAPLATPDETETSDVSNACDVSVLFVCFFFFFNNQCLCHFLANDVIFRYLTLHSN